MTDFPQDLFARPWIERRVLARCLATSERTLQRRAQQNLAPAACNLGARAVYPRTVAIDWLTSLPEGQAILQAVPVPDVEALIRAEFRTPGIRRKQVAEYLGVAVRTLHNWEASGAMPRTVRSLRKGYRREELVQWLLSLCDQPFALPATSPAESVHAGGAHVAAA